MNSDNHVELWYYNLNVLVFWLRAWPTERMSLFYDLTLNKDLYFIVHEFWLDVSFNGEGLNLLLIKE